MAVYSWLNVTQKEDESVDDYSTRFTNAYNKCINMEVNSLEELKACLFVIHLLKPFFKPFQTISNFSHAKT